MGQPGFGITQATANTAVSVLTTSTLIIAANSKRHGLTLVNDGAYPVYLFFGAGPAVANSGLRLNANGGATQLDCNALWLGAVYGIAVGGTSNVTVAEFGQS